MSNNNPLRKIVPLFRIVHLYTKVSPGAVHSEVEKPRKLYSVWLARSERHFPDWLIVDRDGHVSPAKLELCLSLLTDTPENTAVLEELKKVVGSQVFRVGQEWGCEVKQDDIGRYIDSTAYFATGILVTPIARLKEVESLKPIDWPKFVDELVGFKTDEKDPALRLVHRAHLFRGISPLINPHSMEVTNGGTTKSTFYDMVGENLGKATASAFLGFAKSPKEVFPGVLDGSELPTGIDQIESQSAPQIMRFMFNALERGWDYVIGGATKFRVQTSSIIALLANTYAEASNPEKSFAALLDHISFNPAIGRRFAIILYGSQFKKVTKKPHPTTIEEWHQAVALFRAVEEFAWDRIQTLVHSKPVWDWLNQPIEGYAGALEGLMEHVQDDTVRTFVEEHGSGAHSRIRGAALYAAMADHLKDIALDKSDPTQMLEDAEGYLKSYVELNLNSIGVLSKEYAKEMAAQRSTLFSGLSDYLKEIISAVELWRRSKPAEQMILLQLIPYEPKNKEAYPTLKECIRPLNRLKNPAQTLDLIVKHFGIDIVKDDVGSWKVILRDSEPINEIVPLGTYGQIGQIGQIGQTDAKGDTPSGNLDPAGSLQQEVPVTQGVRMSETSETTVNQKPPIASSEASGSEGKHFCKTDSLSKGDGSTSTGGGAEVRQP